VSTSWISISAETFLAKFLSWYGQQNWQQNSSKICTKKLSGQYEQISQIKRHQLCTNMLKAKIANVTFTLIRIDKFYVTYDPNWFLKSIPGRDHDLRIRSRAPAHRLHNLGDLIRDKISCTGQVRKWSCSESVSRPPISDPMFLLKNGQNSLS
jgi:hypothetical protein